MHKIKLLYSEYCMYRDSPHDYAVYVYDRNSIMRIARHCHRGPKVMLRHWHSGNPAYDILVRYWSILVPDWVPLFRYPAGYVIVIFSFWYFDARQSGNAEFHEMSILCKISQKFLSRKLSRNFE